MLLFFGFPCALATQAGQIQLRLVRIGGRRNTSGGAMKIADERMNYKDERYPMGSDCVCHIRVWQLDDGRNVVMASEFKTAVCASITNSCERWAAEACRKYVLDPIQTVFIEN